MSQEDSKRLVARAALSLLPEEGQIGLGSGSTAELFIRELAGLVAAGRRFQGVASSDASRQLAQGLGLEVLSDDGPWEIQINIDGADEVSSRLDLIKGGGACHTREKIVNAAAKSNVIIVDESKLSERLGERFAVPVEVLRFGHLSTAGRLQHYGRARLREANGQALLTDSGHYLYDIATGPIDEPAELDRALKQVPGVVETGLFVQRADVVLVAERGALKRLSR